MWFKQPEIRLESVLEGIYTWSFHNWIAIRSEKTHKVTRCNQVFCYMTCVLSKSSEVIQLFVFV